MTELMDSVVNAQGIPFEVIDDYKTAVEMTYDDPAQRRPLVRVGRLPQITWVDGKYVVPEWGWVFKDEMERMEDFQAPMPPLPPNFPAHIIAEAMAETKKWNEVPWAAEVDRKMRLNPDRAVRWEFDALADDKQTWHVDVATMGKEEIVRWSWGDAKVVAPILRVLASVANFFGPLFSRKIRIPA